MENVDDSAKLFAPLFRPELSGVPKYMRLANAMSSAITAGYWKAGDKLPAEDELTELTPFSLGTVQRALRILVDQGIVVRQHGLGSFVAQNDRLLDDPWHCRFLDDDGERILPVFSKVLSREVASGEGDWRTSFPDASEIVRIDRAINVNHEFTVLARFYCDKARLPQLTDVPKEALNGLNFKNLIAQELHLPITRITHDVRAEKMERPIARVIGLEVGDVAIVMRAMAFMGATSCIYYQEFYIPMTHRRLSIPDQLFGASRVG